MSDLKGSIITIGGNVDKHPEEPIFKEFFSRAEGLGDDEPLIGVIPSASSEPIKSSNVYSDLFEEMGANTQVIHPLDRDEANSHRVVEKIRSSDAFFFSGGNQLRITGLFSGTKALNALRDKLNEGFPLGGTSAGAACMTAPMISQGESEDSLLSGEVELSQGLGFIDNAVIDTHFNTRGRFPRLIHVVTENPGILGVGLGEDTAAIWDFDKDEFSVLGSRNVIVIDGSKIGSTNMAELEYGEPIYAENIVVEILANQCKYNYEDREPFFPQGIHPAHDRYDEKN